MVERIAQVCHEANRAYCESLGDTSRPSWEDAPEWQQDSAKNGVQFHIDNPDSKPEDSHNNWMDEKVNNGWVHGEVKDPEKKEHPCLVPYFELPHEQQVKDALFIGVVRALVKALPEELPGEAGD